MANGQSAGDLCAAGRVLTIPSLQINCNNVIDNANLQRVLSVLIGSLSPRLEFAPKPVKNSCAETLFEAVVCMMSVIIAPYVAPYLAPTIMGSTALGVGVTAGILDAGMQELAKGVGLIKHFSWADVLNAAASAGMMNTDKVQSLTGQLQPGARDAVTQQLITVTQKLGVINKLVMYYGLINVSEQLALIAMNKQKGFDVRQLFASMSETAIDNWIGVARGSPIPSLRAY